MSCALFDRATARLMCVDDGHQCKRLGPDGIKLFDCPSPDRCPLAASGHCKLYRRLNVRIDHPDSGCDELSTFVWRTTGVNTIRTLLARMRYLQAFSGNLLAYLPLELRLRGKSTALSHRTPIYYVDLSLRQHMDSTAAMAQALDAAQQAHASGLNQAALDEAARTGYVQGLLEETGEDVDEILREFYPSNDSSPNTGASHGKPQQN